MKKNFLTLVSLSLIACLALFLLSSCTTDKDSMPESFDIPASYKLSLDIYNNNDLLATIDQTALKKPAQIIFDMNISNSKGDSYSYKFVAYKILSILNDKGVTIPEFTTVKAVADDGFSIEHPNLDKAYLAIGEVKDNKLDIKADYPMLIFDKDSAFGNVMLKSVTELVFNTVVPEVGVEDSDYDISSIDEFTLKLYNGQTLLGNVTKELVSDIAQKTVEVEVIGKGGATFSYKFVAYKLTAILAAMDITLDDIDSVKAYASDDFATSYTSIENSYLALAEIVEEEFSVNDTYPILVFDKNSSANNLLIKNFDRLFFNPVE